MRKIAFKSAILLALALTACGGNKFDQEEADQIIADMNNGYELNQDYYSRMLKLCDKGLDLIEKEHKRIAELPADEQQAEWDKLDEDLDFWAMNRSVELMSIELDNDIEELDEANLKYYRKLEKRVKQLY